MAKKYILKTVSTGPDGGIGRSNRSLERNLINLSALGIKWNSNLIKNIRTDVDMGYDDQIRAGGINMSMMMGDDFYTRAHQTIAGNNQFIAYYDQTYRMRRDFLRKFALQSEIDYVLETVADSVIVNDDMHYFAYPNTKNLKSILTPEHGKEIVDDLNGAYRRIYHLFHFNESNDAWHYVKKLLIDGFLAFEIIYSDTDNGRKAKDIIGFKELDPITLAPEIKIGPDGSEYKVWIVNKGSKENERELLDTNVIYISWAKNNFVSHFSYCERLIRAFNMLRTLENSRIIWNVQNAQKRVKIVVPIGSTSEQIAKTRLRELEAYYKEDINIDNMSGEITVNGQPKFSFAKTMVFPSKDGTTTEIGEIGIEGHDMNSTEPLKWFWQRFIIETRLPKDRFNMIFDGSETSIVPDNSTMTKEEYRFSLFIDRIRGIFKEILIKPTWLQFCLHHPEFASNNVLKNAFGLTFTEENVFRLAKEAANLSAGANIIQTLAGIQDKNGVNVFSTRFLVQRYLNFTDDDWKLNEKLKADEEKEALEKQREQQNATPPGGLGGGGELGGGLGGGDLGGGLGGGDLGGGELGGGELGGGEAPVETPAEAPAETPEV